MIDASNVCQLRCPLCLNTKGLVHKTLTPSFLSLEHFQHVLDSNPWIEEVELSNWGEVFLNREISSIFEVAHRKNVRLTINNGANLNRITEEAVESLVKYQVHRLTCSIDGATQSTYEKYRVGGDVNKVFANIRKINETKEKYRSSLPQLRWQFIAFGHNEHEIDLAKEIAKELKMEFWLKLASESSKDFSPISNKEKIRQESGTGVASREEYFQRFGKKFWQDDICTQLWHSPQINSDGLVLGCSHNTWGNYGNSFTDGVLQCLNGSKMHYARQMLRGKKPPRADIPCTECRYFHSRKETGTWVSWEQVSGAYVVLGWRRLDTLFKWLGYRLLSLIPRRTA